MLFNSYIFIFLFLPITLIGWHGLNHIKKYNLAIWFLTAMSLIFYGYFNISYSLILIGSIGLNHIISKLMDKSSLWSKKLLLILGVTLNLGILGYFKYYNFFIDNINSVFHLNIIGRNILLPLGISFFTFQQLSFVIDRYKGDAPSYNLTEYAAYVTFFPQLIAGPIVLHSQLIPQLCDKSKKHLNIESFEYGICYFVLGLSKKILIADLLASPVNYAFTNIAALDTPSSILVILAFAMEILFDFSGYSDMAIGLGKMFGIELPVNFNSPLASHTIKEFWKRWHITLGNFFTNYVYIPLGGSRKGKARTLLNVIILFSLSGLWHGADWTYVLWGLMQAVAICIETIFHIKTGKNAIVRAVQNAFTFIYFSLSLVFFRSDNVRDALLYFKRMFSLDSYHYIYTVCKSVSFNEGYVLQKYIQMRNAGYEAYYLFAIFMITLVIAIILSLGKSLKDRMSTRKIGTRYALFISILFIWCVLSLGSVSTFLYFNF